ncbi:MAG: hypothetical protein ABI588_03420 [Arenimonas sp.]
MPNCRRKALWSFGLGLGLLALAWLAHAAGGASEFLAGIVSGFGVGLVFAGALLWFSPDMSDAVPKRLIRRYQRDMGVAMGAYVAVMLVWKRLLDSVDATWLLVLVALFPALLVGLVLRAFVRYVRDSDEMQRRIELESGAIAGLLVSALYMAAGFLQSADLIAIPAKVAMLWVFPSLCLLYGVTKVIVSRHYV